MSGTFAKSSSPFRHVSLALAFGGGLVVGIVGTTGVVKLARSPVAASAVKADSPKVIKDGKVPERVAQAPSLDLILQDYRVDSVAAERKYNNGRRVFFFGNVAEVDRASDGGWMLKIGPWIPMGERGMAVCHLEEFDPAVPRLFSGRQVTVSGVRWLDATVEPNWIGIGFSNCNVEKL
jgi:hypothetical protein